MGCWARARSGVEAENANRIRQALRSRIVRGLYQRFPAGEAPSISGRPKVCPTVWKLSWRGFGFLDRLVDGEHAPDAGHFEQG